MGMKHLTVYSAVMGFILSAALGMAAMAQVPVEPTEPPLPELAPTPAPKTPEAAPDTDEDTDTKTPEDDAGDKDAKATEKDPATVTTSPEARKERLDALFAKLKAAEDAESANLVAEEIWAVWLQSGSASIDYILLRGSDAQEKGDLALAQRMFDHVTLLAPDYAEGWSRSGRLAMDMENFSMAIDHTQKALALEPRHFYALWTYGNMLERMKKLEEAYDVYQEALKYYPQLAPVKSRAKMLESSLQGDVL